MKQDPAQLDHAYLLEILDYDQNTGVFKWKKAINRRIVPGLIAGFKISKSRYAIGIHGKQYLLHRLAWFYVNKIWPPNQIDHIDRNPENNAYKNLRLATCSENLQNKKNVGCYFVAGRSKPWCARVHLNGKPIWRKYFVTKE